MCEYFRNHLEDQGRSISKADDDGQGFKSANLLEETFSLLN